MALRCIRCQEPLKPGEVEECNYCKDTWHAEMAALFGKCPCDECNCSKDGADK